MPRNNMNKAGRYREAAPPTNKAHDLPRPKRQPPTQPRDSKGSFVRANK